MIFQYFLDNNAGWAGLIFEDEDISLNYSISYCMGDNLTELLGGIIEFIEGKTKIPSIKDITEQHFYEDGTFEWNINEEGSNIKFLFTKTEDIKVINLKIIENYEEEKCVFNKNIKLNELLENILFSCSEILRKYGIIGYSLNFWNDFPIVYYLILKDFIRNEIEIESFCEINNSREQDMFRSNINKEIEYLNIKNET